MNSSTARLNVSGCSQYAEWAALGITSDSQPRMRAAKRRSYRRRHVEIGVAGEEQRRQLDVSSAA